MKASQPKPGEPLSQREQQVLEGMSYGKPNAEIGRDLFLSEDTIKTHARRLFIKIGARDRAHATRVGLEAGYLRPDKVRDDMRYERERRPVAVRHFAKCFTGAGCQCAAVAS